MRRHFVKEFPSERDPEYLHKLQEWAVLPVMTRQMEPTT